jgi:hypothetical protein
VLSGAMISMGMLLEKPGPALYSPERVEGGSAKLDFRFTEFYEVATVFIRLPCGERYIADTRRRTVPPPLLESRPASLVVTR